MVDNACEIAIIGMAGRFPGAPDVGAFWKNICAGTESIRHFKEAEMDDAFDAATRALPNYVRARAIIDEPDMFDAEFFEIHRRDAELIDPQHRIFLECCWEALEDAGYDPQTYPGAIGVFGGSSINTYFLRQVLARDAHAAQRFVADYPVASYAELLGAGADFLTTRVAYKLNLRGPAMTVQSACSTSLLSVAQAAQALMLGQADMMLAGGVSISFPQQRGYIHQSGGMVSADGHCRTFDAAASGTVFGDGAGVVVLKRLADALADGDSISAVIRGIGVNNDASEKIGFTAPSIDGQARAVRAAHAMAAFTPDSVGYIECHGTATPLGDPIEIAALARAFSDARDSDARIMLGAVKPNVGHLDVAAGITGLIKTALVVREATIPATLHFTVLNPQIDFAGVPFEIASETTTWEGERRRAGVSAFGVGGTNVHLALEAAPVRATAKRERSAQLLVLSARSESALLQMRANLAVRLAELTDDQLPDVAYTLALGRRTFAYRTAIVASSIEETVRALEAPLRTPAKAADGDVNAAFMFPGQGAQYPAMGAELYERNAIFTAAIDRCAAILEDELPADLRTLLFPRVADEAAHARLRNTEIAQVALFAVEYALSEVWTSWGITPAAMIGHSVGEFVAAVRAGVFSLEEALRLVHARGRLMGTLPGGTMLAVRLSEDDIRPYLGPGLDLAAVNAPKLSVVSGPDDAVTALERELQQRGVTARRLHTSHAFHSAMMTPVVEPLRTLAAGMSLSAPEIAYVSCVTGDWIDDASATSPDYWGAHCREPVRFAAGLATLVDAGMNALIEIGPGATLSTFAAQGAAGGGASLIVRSLPTSEREQSDLARMLESAGALWIAGATLDFSAIFSGAHYTRVSLPAYAFERRRFWIDSTQTTVPTESFMATETPSPAPLPAAQTPHVMQTLTALFEEVSGEDLSGANPNATFLELGFDSLFLGRIVQNIQARFGVQLKFRQLLDALSTMTLLSEHIARDMPAPPAAALPVAAPALSVVAPVPATELSTPSSSPAPQATSTLIEGVVREQLAAMQSLMRDQLSALGRFDAPVAPTVASPVASPIVQPPASLAEVPALPSRFEAFRVTGSDSHAALTPAQERHIAQLIAQTTARTPQSKERTARDRKVLADPRVAAGFRLEWKEMVYPITTVRAKGSRVWDVDGNEYIDILNGFGQTAFGHSPDFVVDAIGEQMRDGFAIGPQTDLAGQAAQLFCKLTGNERVTFCNTGSEAVMAAMRVARTVTGRSKIVMFEGSYHGQFDEVLVKGTRGSQRSLPVAAGIPKESVSNMIVLEYGTPASLEFIREHAHELAAIIAEPVQSRHPGHVPREFLTALREIATQSGCALVFDEVVTGFRTHAGGMQAILGIRADLATYGKVAGGGMPIGILAGTARFMDALDGGAWQYGDDSQPEVPPTFFAGTFVRHPLAMAALVAVLRHLDANGPELQTELTAQATQLVDRLNDVLAAHGVQTSIDRFASFFHLDLSRDERLSGLLYYHMRNRGIYLQEGFPCFLTTAHTEVDIDAIVTAFDDSLTAMQSAGFFATAAARVVPERREIPLTESQAEVWLAVQMGDEASCAFNESVTMHINGDLDRDALQAAWKTLIARHESLRATISPTGETMLLASDRAIRIRDEHAPASSADDAQERLSALCAQDARMPFDLVAGPLVRATLLPMTAHESALVVTAHHLICDGWSINVMLEELGALYAGAVAGTDAGLPVPLAFSQYAADLQTRDDATRTAVASYWLDEFRDVPEPLDLPFDRPRPAVKTYSGATRRMSIDAALRDRIRAAGASEGATLFTTLLAAFYTLVGALADRRDVTVGVPVAGQAAREGDVLVGHCVNFLPVRARWERDTTVGELLRSVKSRVLDAYEHQEYTLGTLVRALDLDRGLNRVPLAEVQFNLERLADGLTLDGVRTTVESNAKAFVNFDLFLNVTESADGLRLDCDYSTDLFDASTVDRWLVAYQTLLQSFAESTQRTVSTVDYLPPGERNLLTALNATDAEYPRERCIHVLIEQQAARNGSKVAVTCGDESLTYAQLDAGANRLANAILKRTGGPGKLVGLLVSRSLDMVVGLLATLKAGCAYVPLDPTHPAARLRRILAEADVAALLCDDAAIGSLATRPESVINLRADAAALARESQLPPAAVVSADDLAYVIYTSGSTGAPKGVEVTHRNVVNFLTSMTHKPGIAADDVLLAVTTISFDIAGLEIYLPLTAGATVMLASSEEAGDGYRLRNLVESATILQATPATWRLLLEAGFAGSPNLTMLCGGENLPRDLADRLLAGGGALWNMYGPTETTIWSSCARVRAGSDAITIGKPIANTQMFVLDEGDRMVAPGVSGQLHIAGDGVARGYFKREALTAEKFVANPFGPGTMYRTGDVARVRADGEIQVLGRSDRQIKLRGYRIELGEIEAILEQKGQLAGVAVTLRESASGNAELVAYFVERAHRPQTAASLRLAIADDLPGYMIPTVWVPLTTLPLLPSGKVDRAALPVPAQSKPAHDLHLSLTPLEESLARIWADVMQTGRIGPNDNLFDLGVDSLQIFAITARANAQGLRIAAKELFRYPTVAALARRLQERDASTLSAVAG